MSQQGAAAAAGCCCRRETESCLCWEMDLAGSPSTVTMSAGLTISVDGYDYCGGRIFGGGSFGSMVLNRTLLIPSQGVVRYSRLSECGSHNITGIIGCNNRQCVVQRNCTAFACDAPVFRQQITDALPWFQDTQQITTVVGNECSGVSYSYPPPTCEYSNPTPPTSHPTAIPGQLAVFPSSASIESTAGSNPCHIRAAANVGVLNYRAATECQNFQTVWNWPNSPCTISGVNGVYRKLCRYPGDTIMGTYIREGGEDTEVCTHTARDQQGNFLWTITVQRTYSRTLTVS
jgi:hypothetical protein